MPCTVSVCHVGRDAERRTARGKRERKKTGESTAKDSAHSGDNNRH